jgi:hypothetical protein
MNVRLSRLVPAAAALALLIVLVSRPALAQVIPAADAGGFKIWVGGEASAFKFDYGQQKLGGITALADVDTRRGIGVEGEARWLEYRSTNNMVHVESYSVGARYHRNVRRFQPYVKGLIGFGDFNFPYNYAYGRYTLVTMGGGVDYQWKKRISIRAVDMEYHMWPQFTYGSMNDMGVSMGVRVKVF